MDYSVKLRLSHLIDVQVLSLPNKDGKEEEGIFIPFKRNRIFKGQKSITLTLMAREKKLNTFGDSHFLVPYWGRKEELERRMEQFGEVPFVGVMKPMKYSRTRIVTYNNTANKDYLDEILNKDK